jgi:hypothetical protein
MKMDDIGMRLFEDIKEISHRVRKVPPHVCLHCEAFLSHLLAKRPKSRNRVDARVVPLFPL